MSDHHIDEQFFKGLGDGSLPVREDMWERLEPFLPAPRSRDRTGLLWLLGLLGVAVAGFALWLLLHEQAPEATKDSVASVMPVAPKHESPAETATSTTQTAVSKTVPGSESPLQTTTAIASGIASTRIARARRQTTDQINSLSTNATTADMQSPVTQRSHSDPIPVTAQFTDLDHLQLQMAQRRGAFLMFGTMPPVATSARKLPDPAKDCYDFGGKKRSGSAGFFLEAYTGPTISMKKMNSRGESVNAYIASRDSTESSKLSWHAGLRGGYVFGNGISLRIGGHYTLVNELFDYYDGSFTQTTTRIDTIWDAQGNIVDMDTIIVIESGKRIKTTHNRYHTIDIPILIGYQVNTRTHWTYGIQAGPALNVMFRKKGDILGPNGDPVPISDSDANAYPAFRNTLGLSLYASAFIGKRIGFRTTLFAEPYFHHRLQSVTQDSYEIDQRQTNVGLSIGLRYMLN